MNQAPDPLNLSEVTRQHMVEFIMAMQGRSAENPVQYRKYLDNLNYEALAQIYAEVMDQ